MRAGGGEPAGRGPLRADLMLIEGDGVDHLRAQPTAPGTRRTARFAPGADRSPNQARCGEDELRATAQRLGEAATALDEKHVAQARAAPTAVAVAAPAPELVARRRVAVPRRRVGAVRIERAPAPAPTRPASPTAPENHAVVVPNRVCDVSANLLGATEDRPVSERAGPRERGPARLAGGGGGN